MKNLKKFALLFIAAGAITMTSCGDDDDGGTSTPSMSNTDLITEKNFVPTDLNATIDGQPFLSFDDLDDCEKDDFTRFEKNGTAVDNEGPTKCDPSDPQTDTYSWMFLNNESDLQLDFGMGDIEVFNIVTNDGTTLKVRQTDVDDYTGDGNDNTVVSTLTFTKQ